MAGFFQGACKTHSCFKCQMELLKNKSETLDDWETRHNFVKDIKNAFQSDDIVKDGVMIKAPRLAVQWGDLCRKESNQVPLNGLLACTPHALSMTSKKCSRSQTVHCVSSLKHIQKIITSQNARKLKHLESRCHTTLPKTSANPTRCADKLKKNNQTAMMKTTLLETARLRKTDDNGKATTVMTINHITMMATRMTRRIRSKPSVQVEKM